MDDVRLLVIMFNPSNLTIAHGLAKIKEKNVNLSTKHLKPPNSYSTKPRLLKNSTPKKPNLPLQRINQTPMKEIRENGLCYYCDAKWNLGYKCQNPKLYLLEEVLLENKVEHEHKTVPPKKEGEGKLVQLVSPQLVLNLVAEAYFFVAILVSSFKITIINY